MKYHDNDYDGVVLKLPSWFISLNKLEPLIEHIHEELEKSEYSRMHFDFTKSMHELENYKTKKADIEEKKAILKAANEKEQQKFKKLVSGEIYELDWIKNTSTPNRESILIGEKYYNYEDYFTDKRNIKSDFKKIFHDNINSYEALKTFAYTNHCIELIIDLEGCNKSLIDINTLSLYCNSNLMLGISYQRLYVKIDWKEGKRNSWRYNIKRLIQFEDDTYGIYDNHNIETSTRFKEYIRKQNMLIKKEDLDK